MTIDIFERNETIAGFVTLRTLPPYRKVFLAYIDILGYKNLIQSLGSKAPDRINQIFITSVEWNKDHYKHVQLSILSDAIVLNTIGCHPAEFFNLHNVVQIISRSLFQEYLLTRGAIVVGDHSQDGNVIVSPALIEAYQLEQQADFPRLLLSTGVVEQVLPAIKEIQNASHIHAVEYENKKRIVDKGVFYKDEEDQLWIADYFSCEPFYCLRHKKTMNHWPGDPEPTDQDLGVFYAQAIREATKFKDGIVSGLQREAGFHQHYRKWHYLARKFNGFLSSAKHIRENDKLNLLIT